MRFWVSLAITVLVISFSWAQRICQSPDSLYVDSTGIARSLHLFVYVPPNTDEFTLAIFDQADDEPVGQPSSFSLFAPNGSEVMKLNNPQSKAWSEYKVTADGRWGIWRLTVVGPQPPQGQKLAVRNCFLVRTIGNVDLFIKLEPAVLLRGVRFSEPKFGGEPIHRFTVQVPELTRIRFNFVRPREEQTVEVELQPPEGVTAEQNWGGLSRGSLEFLEINGSNLKGLWGLRIRNVKGVYGLGIEQELRVFFNNEPLMPMPQTIHVTTFIVDENTPVPIRLDITSPQTATETYVTFTDRNGFGTLFLLPDISYRVTASRGFEFEPQTVTASAEQKTLSVSIRRVLRRPYGWYCGDPHVHTVYSDGNDTPAQIVEAARGEGLDWVVITDHGVGPAINHVLMAHQEALPFSEPGKFIVIPGEEFTTPNYHVNIINGTVKEISATPLQQVIEVVFKMDTEENPVTVKINHPHWTGTPKTPELIRQLEKLPLIELWNDGTVDGQKLTILLWWELLNKGMKVFATTATDSHTRKAARLGSRRTYVFLGDTPLSAASVVRALREGRSFLSRGALLLFTANNSLPGYTVSKSPTTIKVWVQSIRPVDKVEIVHNGKVIYTFAVEGKTEFTGEINIAVDNGWLLAQAFGKDDPIPLAMTNPIFVHITN
ncbi:MAG: CehA/McbA family metallohydrolase [Armatimonadota bacterium]|nr:CehA/McbA family metallohydrolase [Armatimonadota bacterium]MDW8026638.1 CehA/McbA family metallohydrolase [Armatimonadota bacterium]